MSPALTATLSRRFNKLASFVDRRGLFDVVVFPWPTREAGFPYFMVNPIDNSDGHGGYTSICHFDEEGLPYQGTPARRIYRPLVLARYGMKMLAVSKSTGDPEARCRALRVLQPLSEAALLGAAWGEGATPQSITTDRPSAMIQGVVISAILRLVDGTPTPRLRKVLRLALRPLLTGIERGGTQSKLSGGPFLEEFPNSPPSHVLNGAIYGLLGLYDLEDTLGDRDASDLARRIEGTLKQSIHDWMAPLDWSYYALNVHGLRPLSSMHYHQYHRFLLGIVAKRTGDQKLFSIAERWHSSIDSLSTRLVLGPWKAAQALRMRAFGRITREG